MAHALPKDFALTDEMINYAFAKSDERGFGWDIRYVQNVYEEFCNHYWSKGEERVDWISSYRKWILKNCEYAEEKMKRLKKTVRCP